VRNRHLDVTWNQLNPRNIIKIPCPLNLSHPPNLKTHLSQLLIHKVTRIGEGLLAYKVWKEILIEGLTWLANLVDLSYWCWFGSWRSTPAIFLSGAQHVLNENHMVKKSFNSSDLILLFKETLEISVPGTFVCGIFD